jgi:geranylgeranylglycerol-phosphate geranylgeranyltransferase
LVLACLSAALIAAGGYVVNDLFDLEIDRINRPGRPLPRGDLSLRQAGVWAITLLGAGPLLAWTLGRATGLTATGVAVGLVLYAAYLKRTAFVGHVLVAVMSGTAFAYGGMVGPRTDTSLVPAILAGAFHLGREMFKAAADWLGDRRGGLRTMAVRWGVKKTCRLAIVPLAVVVVLSPLPTVWGWFGSFYLITVTVGVDTVLLYAMYRAWQSPDMKTAQRLADLLKWDMVAGLVAVGGDRWLNWLPLIGR